jgi:hypothetical protein
MASAILLLYSKNACRSPESVDVVELQSPQFIQVAVAELAHFRPTPPMLTRHSVGTRLITIYPSTRILFEYNQIPRSTFWMRELFDVYPLSINVLLLNSYDSPILLTMPTPGLPLLLLGLLQSHAPNAIEEINASIEEQLDNDNQAATGTQPSSSTSYVNSFIISRGSQLATDFN